jgi:lipoprotein-anchoring transpeptidase ErfK/SrfK
VAENKPKFDSIQKPKQIKKLFRVDKNKPLLSILEPVTTEVAKTPANKKPNILVRDFFDFDSNKKTKVKKKKEVKETTKKNTKPTKTAKPVVPVNKETNKPMYHKHHKVLALFGLVLVIVCVLALFVYGALYTTESFFAYKVYPGVSVWGQNVGGKTVAQVEKIVNEKATNYQINLTAPGQTYTAKASDLGLEFNSEDMALAAYAKGRSGSYFSNLLTKVRLLGASLNWPVVNAVVDAKGLQVKPSYQVNYEVLSQYVTEISGNVNITAKDSTIQVTNGTTVLVPAIYGRQVDSNDLAKNLEDHISELSAVPIQIKTSTVTPSIVDAAAQTVMVEANSVMERPVNLTYQGQTYTPDQQTVASWITFVKAAGAENYTLTINPSLMTSYFSFLESKINVAATNEVVQVTNGTTSSVTQAGVNGLAIDTASLGKAIAAELPNQPSVSLAIPTVVVPYKTTYNNIVVADWAKYIDVDLTTQTMCAYLAGGNQQGCWLITSGRDSLPTPTGTFLILRKVYVTSMPNPPSPYPLTNIHYVSYFTTQGDAIHEAWWRSSFGGQDYHWDGSHGCINAPIGVAEFIYNWAPIGTPVIVHY